MENKQINYQKAREAWNYFIITNNNNTTYYLVIFVLSLLSIFSNLFLYFERLEKPQYYPYYVYITGSEDIKFTGKINMPLLTINDAVVRQYLIRFITNIRSRSIDIVELKNNFSDCFYMATKDTQRQLISDLDMRNNFDAAHENKRRDVQFISFIRIAENRWKVDWLEDERIGQKLLETATMSGTFSYIRGNPETEVEAEKNPNGLYFSEYYITRNNEQ